MRSTLQQQRNYRYRTRYSGITAKQKQAIWTSQGGRCAICKRELTYGKQVHLDHDHETGQIRGYLCNNCNCGIGSLKDDPEIMRAAAAYIEHNKKAGR